MSVRLCAIVDRAPSTVPPGARVIGAGPYLVVEDADPPRADLVLARLALLRSLQREVACLPCRIDAVAADDAEALAWLAARDTALASVLARVAGKSEFDLHVTPPARPAEDEDGPGARHLAALAGRYAALEPAAGEALAAAVRAEIAGVADAVTDRSGSFVAFLVEDAEAFGRGCLGLELQRHVPAGATLRWSGPWPAFTFAATWVREAVAA